MGADQPSYQPIEPIVAPLGTLHHVGSPGAGAAAKLVMNSVLGAAIVAFGEALARGDTLGLDRSVLLDVLAECPIAGTADRAGHPPPRPRRPHVTGSTKPPGLAGATSTSLR
jgi:3-hydroxyisobutyrate dehydrogenase